MAAVELHEVHKSFGRTEVIKGVSTTIDHGEMRVILGPSGCGKSTVLRMIAGLEEITAGTVRIGERVVNRLEPKDRDIAMVFQNYALYPHMSVYDNMAYGLRNRRTPRDEIERRVREAARILGLSDLLQRKPRQLSGGQRQRVAMGRAIVREPAVFLFDEPLSNLDAKLRAQMRIEIKQLQQRLGTTGIFVTHDQVEAMTLGDRLMVMNAGVVEQLGTPLEVYERPATLFVAGFIGSPAMNFLDAVIDRDGAAARIGAHRLPLPAPRAEWAERPVKLGIRPEHLAPAPSDRADLVLEVELVELLGADSVVHGRLAGTEAELLVRLQGGAPVAAGYRLPLACARQHLHLFDAQTGARLALPSESDPIPAAQPAPLGLTAAAGARGTP
jgi:sn-glycerol 3-phosphate transport system ATP-binding protein